MIFPVGLGLVQEAECQGRHRLDEIYRFAVCKILTAAAVKISTAYDNSHAAQEVADQYRMIGTNLQGEVRTL